MEDLTGKVYNDLTAIKRVGHIKGKGQVWLWKCICGELVQYSVTRVRTGHTLSCGCRRSRECKTIKLCRHCGEESRRLNRHGNFASVCQKCYNKQTNDFKYRNPANWMFQSAKLRAKKHGVPFNIDIADICIPEYCPVLGIKLEVGTRKWHDASPSLDRIVPSLGYVKGNVAVISHRANFIKSSGSLEEHKSLVAWLEKSIPCQ